MTSQTPIYDPSWNRPLRIVGFFSGGASSLKELLKNQDTRNYEIVGALTDRKDARALSELRESLGDNNLFINDWNDFLKTENLPQKRLLHSDGTYDPEALAIRERFDQRSCELIENHKPDLLVFSGYMKIVSEALYGRYVILNVHPADLALLDDLGNRKYIGDDAVFDAIKAGETSVRATIHVITGAVDGGPTVGRSPPLNIPPFTPIEDGKIQINASGDILSMRDFADQVQDTLKTRGDMVIFQDVIDKICTGRIAVAREGIQVTAVFIDDKVLPYNGGYQMN